MTSVPEGEREQRIWLSERGTPTQVLQRVPVRPGDTVLDFGCGAGAYALPAAALVGPAGVVHALDCDAGRLDQLRAAIAEAAMSAITVIVGDGGTSIALGDGSCDVALLYDVLQKIDDRESLFLELRRVLRPGGVLSIYPMHLDAGQVRAAVEAVGFRLRDDFAGLVLNFVRE